MSAFDSYLPSKSNNIPRATHAEDSIFKKSPICYRCKETGHVATTCKLTDKRSVSGVVNLANMANLANMCNSTEVEPNPVRKVQLISQLNDVYKKKCEGK